MSFDFDATLGSMGSVIGKVAKEEAGDIGDYGTTILQNQQESLQMLIEARLSGDLSEEEFQSEMEREKSVMEAELLTLDVMTKAATQKAINAAIDILTKAVSVAL